MVKISKCKIMVKCAICFDRIERGKGYFFKVPTDESARLRWSMACQTQLGAKDRICSDHFLRSNIVCRGRKVRLLENAVPLALNASNFKRTVQEDELINEALFDDKEIAQHQNISDDADNAITPSPISTIIKTEDDEVSSFSIAESIKTDYDAIIPFSILKDIHHDNKAVKPLPISKSIQTDEASEDRINCGFVNVSKNGPDKYFNLRCFYCDAEYPISFWSEFSDHIIYNHGHLENNYDKKDVLEVSTSEHNMDVMDFRSKATEGLPPINFINLDETGSIGATLPTIKENKHYSELMDILADDFDSIDAQYMYVEKYEPNIDHNYSKYGLNKSANKELMNHDEPIDGIRFGKTPRNIVIDFLEHLKGYPSLWHNRKIDCEKYDNELLKLMNIMIVKWNLNLRMNHLRKDLENIKAWFNGIRVAMVKNGNNNVQHIFNEYYEKCAEFLTFGHASKLDFLCHLCNRSYANAIQLQVHKYRKHKTGQLPYCCSKCDLRFTNIDSLLSHVKKHVPRPPKKKQENEIVKEPPSKQTFECLVCNENFRCANEYKMHLDIHPKGDCPFACEECGKRYKSITGLNEHRNRHKKIGYQCEFCPLKLTTPFILKAHMNLHKGIYEYICEWCGRGFVCRNRWTEHVKFAHLGHGVCKICNREYKKRSILHKHLRNLHRPIFGTVEELSKPRRRCATRRGKYMKRGEINGIRRKYEYVIDPVTQTRRLKCPKCDKSYLRHRNVLLHASKVHNCDLRSLKRLILQRPEKQKLFQNDMNDEKAATINSTTECSDTKFENSVYTINDAGSNVCIATDIKTRTLSGSDAVIEMNEIHDGKNTLGISFQKFVSEITPNNNFSFRPPSNILEMDGQSTEQMHTPVVGKVEDFGSSSFVFTLNTIH